MVNVTRYPYRSILWHDGSSGHGYFTRGMLGAIPLRLARILGILIALFPLLSLGMPVVQASSSAMQPLTLTAGNPHGHLRIEPMVAYNFIVDSNVETPATYAPTSAMLAAHICNDGATELTDVQAMVGDFDPNGDTNPADSTPGLYPSRTNPPTGQIGTFQLVHEGGSLGAADATRSIGLLPAGECVVQYWLVSYPRLDANGTTVTRGIKPFDDLWLEYDFWASAKEGSTPLSADLTRRAYMRNEISAMANKIWPNTTSKVPNEYLAAISETHGWSTAASDGSNSAYPGGIITTKGVWFDLGNIGAGFDNDGDLVPDRNAWLQPVGDPGLFDAGCFRLIKAHGILVIKLNNGTKQLIEFEDQLYFEHIPGNNTGGVGIVNYDFAVLGSDCTSSTTPYQEVASGYDNEKFNGDFGTQPARLISRASTIEMVKTADKSRVALGDTIQYTIGFTNTGTAAVGQKRYGLPLVISDTVPAGTTYVAGSAAATNLAPSALSYQLRYSTDQGQSWTTTEPSPASTVTTLQWWLSDDMPGNQSGGHVGFSIQVPVNYPQSLVPNQASASLGGTTPFAESSTQTLVSGVNNLSGFVFADIGTAYGDGVKDGDESGIGEIGITLGLDLDNDGEVDLAAGSTVVNGDGSYTFTELTDDRYIVTVDHRDLDLPAGYGATSSTLQSVALDAEATNPSAVNVTDVNFGFAPSFALEKTVQSTGPLYPNQPVTYTIALKNMLPPSLDVGTCVTATWAAAESTVTSGLGNNQHFDTPEGALGASGPDNSFATTNFSNSEDRVSGAAFTIDSLSGTIAKVEAVYSILLANSLSNDGVSAKLYVDGIEASTKVFTPTLINTFSGAQGLLVWDVTNARTWSLADFNSRVALELAAQKTGGSDGATLSLDAIGFRVTTNQSCHPTTILDPVSLQDRYDPAQLEFVSATPGEDSSTPAGELNWTNVGPLAAGETQTVTVRFRPLDAAAGETVLNMATANVTILGSSTMTVTDTASATVALPGRIGDTIFWDNNTNGQEDWGEQGIQGVTVSLYRDNGDGAYTGSDALVVSKQSDIDGRYLFTNVVEADYFVVVGAIPGSPVLLADPDNDGVVCPSGGTAACDGRQLIELTAGESHMTADFGYQPVGAFGDTVWVDANNNGVRDGGETGLPFVTIILSGAVNLTTTTDVDGYYYFTNLADGTYTVAVDGADPDLPAGLITTKDPDSPIGTADGQSTVVISGGDVSTLGSTACTGCNKDVDFGYRLDGGFDLSGTICFDATTAQDGVCGGGRSGVTAAEGALAEVEVLLYRWIDNGDNLPESGELLLVGTTTTDGNGDYTFDGLPVATYIAASIAPVKRISATTESGYNASVTDVQKNESNGETISIAQFIDFPNSVSNVDFAYVSLDEYDFGDLPLPYSSRSEQNPTGPYHTVAAGTTLKLGALIDSETNGAPSRLADGDGADEDGVVVPANQAWLTNGTLTITAGDSGFLLGWIDFNGDGDFVDSNEAIISQTVGAGPATYTFPIPNDTFSQGAVALGGRFRIFDNAPTFPQFASVGAGAAGEVEDYLFSTGLTIDMDTITPQVMAGETATYVVSVVNTGTLPLSGILISTLLPTGFTYIEGTVSLTDATRTTTTAPTVGTSNPSWGNWTLNPGGTIVITQVVTVAGNVLPGVYDSQSTVTSDQTGLVDDDGLVGQDADTPAAADPETDEDVTIVANPIPTPLVPTETATLVPTPIVPTATSTATPTSTPIARTTPTSTSIMPTATSTATSTSAPDSASIGDRIWLDVDMDGVQDASENGLPNIPVRLYSSSGELITSTVSDDNGYYHFRTLEPGIYMIEAIAPPAYLFSIPNQGDDATDSDANDIGFTGLLTVTSSTQDNTIDFGLFDDSLNVSLGDYIWADINFNGLQDSDEPGLPGVLVNLYHDLNADGLLDDGDIYLRSLVTTDSGFYRFTSLPSDDYIVHVDASNFLPGNALQDYANTHGANDPDDYNESDDNGILVANLIGGYASKAATVLPWSTETARQNRNLRAITIRNPTIDFGFHLKTVEIGDRVWLDSDRDGLQDPGEVGVPGVVVNLYSDNTLVATTTTDGQGEFVFAELSAGTYELVFIPPAAFGFTPLGTNDEGVGDDIGDSDADPTTGRTAAITLAPGDKLVTVDAGLTLDVAPASVGDRVWYDTNANGLQDADETGVAGISVRLYRDGALLASTFTDGTGHYDFASLAPGEYIVQFVVPDGYQISTPEQGSDDSIDSDADQTNGRTRLVTLATGQRNQTVDMGVLLPAGAQPAELVINTWYDLNLNGLAEDDEGGVPGLRVRLHNSSGVVIARATTDGDGLAHFPNLVPGSYFVGTPELVFYLPTAVGRDPNGSGSMLEPDTLSTPLTQLDGAITEQRLGVWAMALERSGGSSVLVPGALGDLVWMDTNNNGLQEIGEAGVPDITVRLYNHANVLLSTDVTDAEGHYLFPNLLPGSYYLAFTPSDAFNGFSPTAGGSTDLDSDVDQATGRTGLITVGPATTNLSVDAGLPGAPTALDLTDEPGGGVERLYLPLVGGR